MLFPVILTGGSGTRLWPLSRQEYPKPLLSLLSDRSLLQDTVLRLQGLDQLANPIIVCNQDHRFPIQQQLSAIGVTESTMLLEPMGRNTAPAIAAACLSIQKHKAARKLFIERRKTRRPDSKPRDEALVLVLPADHVIPDQEAFAKAVAQASDLARAGYLVTFGITPDRAETGYGYIVEGFPLGKHGHTIHQFVEKPNADKAQALLNQGNTLWNSGMFLFRCDTMLDELAEFAPDVLSHAREAFANASHEHGFTWLDGHAFSRCPDISIDYAVMEHTQKAAVVRSSFTWQDVGTWTALWEVDQRKDQGNNVTHGDVLLKDTHNCYVRAESKPIAISGLDDLIVIDTPDALLVTRKGQDQQVRQLASSITQQQNAPASPGSDWPKRHKMFTGWGHSITLEQSDTSQVRKVTLLEGHAIQLRAIAETEETWIVQSGLVQFSWETPSGIHTEVLESGTGRVSLTIPRGHNYTIDNLGDGSLEMLAVQSRMDANAADSRYGKHL